MKKITFKVNFKKDVPIVLLLKEISKINCRIFIDTDAGVVEVENVLDNMDNVVIELIDKHCTIMGVDIDNTSNITPDAEPTLAEEVSQEEAVQEEEPKEPKVLEPQSAEDLIIKKVEFQNKYVENILGKLLKTAYWAMYKNNVPEREIGNHIYSCLTEISLKYNKSDWTRTNAVVGDIVECNYGTHLPGEINGPYVHGIVCDILDEGMVYIVPITKTELETVVSKSYLSFSAPEDAEYKSDRYTGGIALLDKGKYIHSARMNCIVGRISENFFNKLLDKLSYTFDFRSYDNILEDENEEMTEIFGESKETSEEITEVSEEIIQEVSPSKKLSEEAALLEISSIKNALDKVDKTKGVFEAVRFMEEISLTTTAEIVVEAFVVACDVERITYASIISKLQEIYSNLNSRTIKQTLQEYFKSWVEDFHPDLAEKCPKISIISLLKLFAKKFK